MPAGMNMPRANITQNQSESIAISPVHELIDRPQAIKTVAFIRKAREIRRSDQRNQDAEDEPRQPSATLSNAGTCKKFPAGVGLPRGGPAAAR